MRNSAHFDPASAECLLRYSYESHNGNFDVVVGIVEPRVSGASKGGSVVRWGFTLLEMMVVMVMIAIVASIALPKMQTAQYRVDGAMRTVQAALQQAERGAVQRQMEVAVSFDTVNNRVRVHYDYNSNHAIDAGEDVRWKPLEEGNRFATPPSGVGMTAGKFIAGGTISTSPDGYPTVYYHRDGASSTGFQVYLRSSSSSQYDFRALVVTQATGRVDLYRYGTSGWQKSGI